MKRFFCKISIPLGVCFVIFIYIFAFKKLVLKKEKTISRSGNTIQFFFPQKTNIEKNDRISAITMKQIAHYHFGDYNVPTWYNIPQKITKKIAKNIR